MSGERSTPAREVHARRAAWLVLAAVLAAVPTAIPGGRVPAGSGIPLDGLALARIAWTASAIAALAWGLFGTGRSLRVEPGGRLPDPAPAGTGDVRRPGAWLLAITALGTVLRLHGLGSELWIDEITTMLEHVDRPPLDLVLAPGSRNVHLLHTLLLQASTAVFGRVEWAVRLPAVTFGIATIPAVYVLARTVLRRREALLAALVAATSYHLVFFSQNARGYSGLVFWTCLSTTLLIRALRGDRARDWVLYGLTAFLGVATALHGLLVLAGHVLALPLVALRLRSVGARTAPLVGKAALAIAVAGLASFDLYATALPDLLGRAEAARRRDTPQGALFWLHLQSGLERGLGRPALVALMVLAIPLGPGAIPFARRHVAVSGILLAPLTATAVLMALTGFHVFPRYFLWAVPVFAIGIVAAAAESAPSRGWVPAAAAALVVFASLAMLPGHYATPKQPIRTSLAWVLDRSVPDDVLVPVGLAADGVRYYGPPLEAARRVRLVEARTPDEMRAIERVHAGRRKWILTTYPLDRIAGPEPLLDHVERRYSRIRTFPAAIERMDVVVWSSPPLEP